MDIQWLSMLVLFIAALYSSAGFGGASGYLTAMSFFSIPTAVMASTALVLNILVSSISFTNYNHAGYLKPKLLVPFLITSIPAAFIGGYVKVSEEIYTISLYIVLTYLALRMLFSRTPTEAADWEARPISLWAALLSGAVIGLLSGMLGMGGRRDLSFSAYPAHAMGYLQRGCNCCKRIHRHQFGQRLGRAHPWRHAAIWTVWVMALACRSAGGIDRESIGCCQILWCGCPSCIGDHFDHCSKHLLVEYTICMTNLIDRYGRSPSHTCASRSQTAAIYAVSTVCQKMGCNGSLLRNNSQWTRSFE